jgi:hypothetical protein
MAAVFFISFFSHSIYPCSFLKIHQFKEFQFIAIIMPLIEIALLWLIFLLGNSRVTSLLFSFSHDHLGIN